MLTGVNIIKTAGELGSKLEMQYHLHRPGPLAQGEGWGVWSGAVMPKTVRVPKTDQPDVTMPFRCKANGSISMPTLNSCDRYAR